MTAVTTEQSAQERRRIVVFSDGTGNSSAKLFKTNVWRLYEAVDVAQRNPRQLVAYDDGVGTSTFKPLALLGGAFGVGLKRNVLDLYKFICRNYRPGDEIYAFGFSRGAFTIRVLVGLLTSEGVIARYGDSATLDRFANDVYRDFRRCFRLPGRRNWWNNQVVERTRNVRDGAIKLWRKLTKKTSLTKAHLDEVPSIEFVGVWDTVAAYGFPIAEITKGIDRWVWPLSMPDYKLSEKVRRARHALALDDERDTFHPLLWDEVHEDKLIREGTVTQDRMRQVWFTGMHSDVGGGYSDDSLSYVSLVWMLDEAQQSGLKLRLDKVREYRDKADPLGPMHDSRSGISAYYRYQPRKIGARMEKPDRTTRILQDPDAQGHGLLTKVRIHSSVAARIVDGTDAYAPIVLPASYVVEGGAAFEHYPVQRADAQERVWDGVWRRRVSYFATLAATFAFLVLGFWEPPAASCIGAWCVLSPALLTLSDFLPSFASGWVESWASRPGWFIVFALSIAFLLRHASSTEQALRDRMAELFTHSRSEGGAAALTTHAQKSGAIWRLRTNSAYLSLLQTFKWRASPGGAAILIYLVLISLGGAVLLSVGHRSHMAILESTSDGIFCKQEAQNSASSAQEFDTSDPCWSIPGESLAAGERYRLTIEVTKTWSDASIVTTPEGFSTHRLGLLLRVPAALVRRSVSDPWFTPLLRIQNGEDSESLAVRMTLADFEKNLYVGEFTAPISGQAKLSVNDAVFLWGGDPAFFYTSDVGRNQGRARVSIEPCNKPERPEEDEKAPDAQADPAPEAKPNQVGCLVAGWKTPEPKPS